MIYVCQLLDFISRLFHFLNQYQLYQFNYDTIWFILKYYTLIQ